MEACRISFRLRKRIVCDGFFERLKPENENVWFEATALHDFCGDIAGELKWVLFNAPEYGVAALNICSDSTCPYPLQSRDQILHRQSTIAANIDTAKESYVCIHSVTTCAGHRTSNEAKGRALA